MRFVRYHIDDLSRTGHPVGLFGAMWRLLRAGELSEPETVAFGSVERWFLENLPEPPICKVAGSCGAVTYFRSEPSAAMRDRLVPLIAILESHGRKVRITERELLREIVYEDEFQVAVIEPVVWYHGSPLVLETLRAGSTITRNRGLARVYSHKPEIVSVEDDGSLRHNGTKPGYMHMVCDTLTAGDIVPHPRSSMGNGDEYATTRDLKLVYLYDTTVKDDEFLTVDDLEKLAAQRSR